MITELSTEYLLQEKHNIYLHLHCVVFTVCANFIAKFSKIERFSIECRKIIIVMMGFCISTLDLKNLAPNFYLIISNANTNQYN